MRVSGEYGHGPDVCYNPTIFGTWRSIQNANQGDERGSQTRTTTAAVDRVRTRVLAMTCSTSAPLVQTSSQAMNVVAIPIKNSIRLKCSMTCPGDDWMHAYIGRAGSDTRTCPDS